MNDKPTPPRRRWYQFSLRTMLIVMVVSSAAFGYWVHRSREWIRQRQEFLKRNPGMIISDDEHIPIAPSGLWLFGEQGLSRIRCATLDGEPLPESKEGILLFPEASQSWWHVVR